MKNNMELHKMLSYKTLNADMALLKGKCRTLTRSTKTSYPKSGVWTVCYFMSFVPSPDCISLRLWEGRMIQ